jgi:hypothetical protein
MPFSVKESQAIVGLTELYYTFVLLPLLCHHLSRQRDVRRRAAALALFPHPLFSACRAHLGNLRDDLFADDLDGTQDVLLGLHHGPQQHMRGPQHP